MLESHFGFNAAPGRAITGNDDGPFDGNAHPLKFFVIVGNAVVDVNERRRDVAINRVRVVRRQLLGLLARGRIFGDRRLLQLGHEANRLDHFENPFLRRGEKDLK